MGRPVQDLRRVPQDVHCTPIHSFSVHTTHFSIALPTALQKADAELVLIKQKAEKEEKQRAAAEEKKKHEQEKSAKPAAAAASSSQVKQSAINAAISVGALPAEKKEGDNFGDSIFSGLRAGIFQRPKSGSVVDGSSRYLFFCLPILLSSLSPFCATLFNPIHSSIHTVTIRQEGRRQQEDCSCHLWRAWARRRSSPR